MSIVLSILQAVGWSLLLILLLLIVGLLIFLFSPAVYMLEGEWKEEKWIRLKLHWLFHLFRLRISYEGNVVYGEVHFFWKKKRFSQDFIEQEAEETEDDAADEIKSAAEDIIEAAENEAYTTEERSADTKEKGYSADTKEKENNAESGEKSAESKKRIVSKIKGIIKEIKKIYTRMKKVLTDKQNQDAVKHLKKELSYLIRILLPKKSKADLVFSTGSPDTTGQLFGILACFPAIYQKDWNLMPDFQAEELYFKGTFWGKGRAAMYQLVGIVIRILLDKNCRKLYAVVQKFVRWIKKEDKSQEEKNG